MLYLNNQKSNCNLGETIVESKFDEDCKELMNGTLQTLTIPNNMKEVNLSSEYLQSSTFKELKYESPCYMEYIGGFANCNSLEKLYVPTNVKKLGTVKTWQEDGIEYTDFKGFSWCNNLSEVTFEKPSSVETISDSCFIGCSSLQSFEIPNSVTSLGISCFDGCNSLSEVTFEEPCQIDILNGFSGCSSLQSIEIPNSVTILGDSCFQNSGLTSIEIPNSVTSLGFQCFMGCLGLTELTIPHSVTSLYDSCFQGCSSLQSITIPNSVTYMGANCLAGNMLMYNDNEMNVVFEEPCQMTYIPHGCFNAQLQLKSFTIPSSVKSLMSGCFSVSGLQTITIPNTVETMSEMELVDNGFGEAMEQESNSQFMGCESLSEVIFEEPCQIKKLPDYCFDGCTSLTEITIPSSVEEISESCFGSEWSPNTSITTITINKPEGSIAGAPWGAENATIIWNG